MAVFQIRQQGRHRRLERRQILPGEIPDQVKSHMVILMNQDIAETGEIAPGDRRVLRDSRRVQLLDDFADHFEAADDPVLQQLRVKKGSASGDGVVFDAPECDLKFRGNRDAGPSSQALGFRQDGRP